MTVSSQTNNVTFVGNGVATSFPLPFRFFSNSHVFAFFVDSVTGISTPMVLGVDYTLTGAGQPEVDGSAVGVLTTAVPLANLRGMYVERVMPQTQETDIVNQGEFFGSTHEDVFDRLTMLIQQLQNDITSATIESTAELTDRLASTHGAGMVGFNPALSYPPGTVGKSLDDAIEEIDQLQESQSNSAPLYFKSKVLEVGFRDSTYDALISTYGYDSLYPQSFAIDEIANELWVLRGASTGANSWAWIWVYDLTTGARKTTFTTGQQWRESLIIRYSGTFGTDRYVYTIGNGNSAIRMLLNTLPANLSTATIANTYAINAQSMMAWDGQNWYVQDVRASQGLSVRNRFTVWPPSMAEQVGQVTLPLDTMGTLQAYTDYFPKAQGVCLHQGSLYVATGGAYDPANPAHASDINNSYYLQGIQSLSPQGEKERTALSNPSSFIANMSTLIGYPASVCETEGVYSTGENLYSIQITLGPTERVNPAFAGKGVVVVKELSTDANRVDFTDGARGIRCPFSQVEFESKCHHSSSQLTNPVTGAGITTFAHIVTMMRELALTTYIFGGTNQTITDLNGAAVDTSGRLIRCTNINGSSFSIECSGASTINPHYFLSSNGTVQSGPIYGDAEYGSNANGHYIKHANGVLECWYNDAAAQATTSALTGTAVANSVYQSSANLTWTFPEPFVGADPEVTISIKANTSIAQVAWATQRNTGTPLTNAVFRIASPYNTASDVGQWRARAIGRWR